jgi:acyl-CoA dehydrogenase
MRVQLRLAWLSVLDAATQLDAHDARAHGPGASARLPDTALQSLAVVKVAVPRAVESCLDFAVQIHGGGGLSNDHPLAAFWAAARTLRLVDGPDEVHLRTLAKLEVAAHGGTRQARPHPGVGRSKL